jgi:hypothetical protein
VEHHHVFDARADGAPVAGRRLKRRALDRFERGIVERHRCIAWEAGADDSGLDVPRRVDHELQNDLHLDCGSSVRKRRLDRALGLRGDHLCLRRPGLEGPGDGEKERCLSHSAYTHHIRLNAPVCVSPGRFRMKRYALSG